MLKDMTELIETELIETELIETELIETELIETELIDITDTLLFEDEPSIFTEEFAIDFVETVLHLMDEYLEHYPHTISEPNFQDILIDDIQDLVYLQLEDHLHDIDLDIEDEIDDLLQDAFDIFMTTFHPDKTTENNSDITFYTNTEEIDITETQIQLLRNIPQPIQRTAEWYQFRWNLITASNAWKAFESQSTINQLIYEKCQPIVTVDSTIKDIKIVNVNTLMHWGQKYEPLSVMLYERNYGTIVEDFGCIKHDKYSFLGASPDGIVVNKESDRYGRMLEIKNVVSREINGIPKKEYWTQMQLQMEVCNLDTCDFLETKFMEYPDELSFKKDRETCKEQGIIIHYQAHEGNPFYDYKPLNIVEEHEISDWEDNSISLYQSDKYNYTFLRYIYWKLDVLSCVLVLRKKDWFKNNIGQIEKVWKLIELERVTGYEHRAPKKNPKKEFIPFMEKESSGCLLTYKKIVKLD
jgi:putative phage-type endonuclease